MRAELLELAHSPTWMYDWQLEPGLQVQVLHPELPSVHRTRAAIIEPVVRETLAAAGPQPSAADVGCSEGWFAHRLLEWGATRVVGFDVRSESIERAELIRDHFGIPTQRLTFARVDVNELAPDRVGTLDVVLMLGLVYHLEIRLGRSERCTA